MHENARRTMSDAAPAAPAAPAGTPAGAAPAETPTPATRARRPLALAVTAVLTAGVFVAVSGSSPVLSSTKSSPGTTEMAYDRDAVADLQRRSGEDRRALMVAWYGALNKHLNEVRRADQQRASRGEPRQALGEVDRNQYWRPTTGPLTQPYHPGHGGIDIGVPVGTPVVSATEGVVTFAGTQSGYGEHIEVRHADGVVTTYSHLSRIDVAVGEPVQTGQQIADSGNTGRSTGPHLHFEVKPGGGATTDPIAWLSGHGAW